MWLLLLPYLVLVLMMMLMETSLIFFPSPYPQGHWQPLGLDPEEVYFEAADGVRLHGWYVQAEQPRAYVLFSHGNAGNITHRADVVRRLRDQLGLSVLIYDYRGYGKSQGRPSGQGVLADARAAQLWLAEREQIEPSDVVLLGRSLGAAIAVHLAAEQGAKALILESAFTSLPDVAAYHYPWLPVRWLMRTRLDAARQIGHYHGPVLQCHGTDDEIIPVELGRKLFDAVPGPKRFVPLTGTTHNDPHPPEYYEAMDQFLSELPR